MDETQQAFNAWELSRHELLEYGSTLVAETLAESGLPAPTVVVHEGPGRRSAWRQSVRGYYEQRTVHVNLYNNRPATKTPGFSWSFPGWKADLTPVGVLAHEVGHWVDELLGFPKLRGWASEASVSSYEPNRGERFAEAFKLLVTNPDLLRNGRPHRWALLEELGLRPVQLVPWVDVLDRLGAHDRFFDAAERWIVRTK